MNLHSLSLEDKKKILINYVQMYMMGTVHNEQLFNECLKFLNNFKLMEEKNIQLLILMDKIRDLLVIIRR